MHYPRILLGFIIAAISFSIIFFLFSLNVNKPDENSNGKIKIVASFFPLADFARQIGQDKVSIDVLFAQTPEVSGVTMKDISKLKEADLVLINGVGFEIALKDIFKSEASLENKIIDTSAGIELIENDPHIWLDPYRAFLQARNIKQALITIDPQNQNYYEINFRTLAEAINNIDLKIANSLDRFGKKDFVSFHDAFIYFNARYGLNKVAVIEEFAGKEPSARYLAEVIDKIKSNNIKTIFSEPQFSPKIIEAIAKDLGLKVFSLDPIETGDLQKESYISKMEKNLETLIRAFSL